MQIYWYTLVLQTLHIQLHIIFNFSGIIPSEAARRKGIQISQSYGRQTGTLIMINHKLLHIKLIDLIIFWLILKILHIQDQKNLKIYLAMLGFQLRHLLAILVNISFLILYYFKLLNIIMGCTISPCTFPIFAQIYDLT